MSRFAASSRRLSLAVLALTLSVVTLPALLVAGSAGPVHAGAAVAAEAVEVSGGTVSWGVKASWRRYIGDGTRAGDGASVTGWDGNTPTGFEFPIESGSYDAATATTTLDLAGWVHFQAYYGWVEPGEYALDTKYSDLTVTIGPDVQEIRGTHTGFLREDPGGELHEDVDVVLATLDVAGAETEFAAEHTAWTDIPTAAGDGFAIYPAGASIDPVTIDYPGPGGIPDLAERFEQPGAPVLHPAERWLTGSTTSGASATGRSLEISPAGDVVYVLQVTPQTSHHLVVQALDATSLEPVGTPFRQPLAATGSTQRFVRSAIDPVTDTLFFLTARDGAGSNELTARALTYDRGTGVFSAETLGSVTLATAAVGALVWNGVTDELAFVGASSVSLTPGNPPRLVRFERTGAGWTASVTAFSFAATGDFPGGQTCTCGSVVSTAAETNANLAVLGDGSYVIATGPASATVSGTRYYAPAQHLRVSEDGSIAVAGIAGTAGKVHPTYAVAWGQTSATPGPGGSVYLHGDGQDQDDFFRVGLEEGVAVAGTAVQGPDVYAPMGLSMLAASMAYDARRDLWWATDEAASGGTGVKLVDDTGVLAGYNLPDQALSSFGERVVRVGADGSLYLPVRDVATQQFGYQRLAFDGIAPRVTAQPEDVAVELAPDEESAVASFTVGVDPELGGTLQWQVRPRGASRFADIEGATGETLTVTATPESYGAAYRATLANDAGSVATEEAALDVTYAPRASSQPRDARVTEGANALFTAEVMANPEVTSFVWQRRVDGFWQDVVADDELTVDIVDDLATLRVADTQTDQSGARFRVKATSSAGTGYSRVATLAVEPTVVVPAEGLDLDGVVLDWTGSEELQAAPPFNGSNYFSAGVSAGDQATYHSTEGDVGVLQVTADGAETPATWAGRAAHVTNGGGQLVRLSGGDARIEPDGSATVTWDGSWSVNFYGGMVPFSVTDPVLSVAADGTGTLTGDLSGYVSSMENPDVRTPMTPAPDVTIATFAGVEIDTAGRVEVTPEYEEVELDVPEGQTAQVRTGAGWGSWPQEFVDVHFVTGLSSYWYSSGGAADPKKRPTPFAVDFSDVTEVESEPVGDVASSTSVRLARTAALYGARNTATVVVTAPGRTPTGTVTLRTAGRTLTAVLTNGRATMVLPPDLRPGPRSLSVTYPGGIGIRPSAARSSLRVGKAVPRIRLALPRTATSAGRVGARVRVEIPGAARLRPVGQVVVLDGRQVVAVKRLTASQRGRVNVRLPRLSRGAHHLRAVIMATSLHRSVATAYRTVVVS